MIRNSFPLLIASFLVGPIGSVLLAAQVPIADENEPRTSIPQDSISREDVLFFETEIRPLLAKNCFSCHGPRKQENGLRVDSRSAILKGGDTGEIVVPGKTHESLLIEVLEREDDQMPPGKRLSGKQIAALKKWVKGGAFWPADSPSKMASIGFSEDDKNYWAFQPLLKSAIPVKQPDDQWGRNEVDRFVWKQFKSRGIQPAKPADQRTLMRRVYFDLIGLPPSIEEQTAFLNNQNENAYEQLVDQLLEDPRYGEKWARHWLDLVRYAESDGYKQDDFRPNAWRYRDYVIRSFNDDKPYNQFVVEQLAGDELDPTKPENLVATGYLRHWIYEYNQRDVRTQWDTILNDMTSVTGDVFLAMSMNCARCHDHKFDPVLQKDFFRLKAFFAPLLPRDDLPLATPAQQAEYQKKRESYDRKTAEIRRQIEELESPYHQKKMNPEIDKFPLDIRPMMRKQVDSRSAFEVQLTDLAFRQVKKLTTDELKKRIKGKELEKWNRLRADLAKFDAEKPKPLPFAFTATDAGPNPPSTTIPDDPTNENILPGVLSVMDPGKLPVDRLAADRHSSQTTGRRLALARWMTQPDNPLTTRVIVNRIWQYHFGRGIVGSSSDFGRLGDRPADRELLDWLARRFVQNGWKFKSLHKLILMSATYRQSAVARAVPNLRPLQQVVRRLSAEQIRDSMLAVSGELIPKTGGPSVGSEVARRTVYNKVIRNRRDPLLDVFDAPDNFNSTSQRNVTTTPNQSLLMINGQWTLKRAEALARRLAKIDTTNEQIKEAYRLAFCRVPDAKEVDSARRFLQSVDSSSRKTNSDQDSQANSDQKKVSSTLVDFCHALLNSNEFLYVD